MSWRIALVAASVALGVLALELGVRMITAFDTNYLDEVVARRSSRPGRTLNLGDFIRPDPDELIVYGLAPSIAGRFLGEPLEINSLGMRDVERTLARDRDAVRIVGLGDSHMFGWGVRREETFLAVLEGSLNRRFPGRPFEAWNLAVPGYNSVQEVETLASKAATIRPDVVIINWVGNDMDLPSFLAERPNVYTVRQSFLYELVRRRLRSTLGKSVRSFTLVPVEADAHTGLSGVDAATVPERYRPLLGVGNMLRAFERLAELARRQHFRPVVLFDWNFPEADTAKAESHDPWRMSFKRRCADAGFLVVDSEERILRYLAEHRLDRSALWISSSDPHPSVLRHRLIGEALFEALVASGAIPNEGSSGLTASADRR